MPSKDKIRGTWIGRVEIKGHPVQKKRGFPTKTAAAEWERQTKLDLQRADDPVYSFFQAADLWLESSLKRCSAKTCRYKANVINYILTFWGKKDKPLKKVTTLDIENYLNSLSGKTANRHKRELNTFFIYALKRGICDHNPVAVIDRYHEEQFKRYVPPAEDVQAVIDIAPPLEKNILRFAYHTLARAGEIRAAKWEDVDFDLQTITLWTGKRAGGNKEADTLDMTDTLCGMLKELYKEKEGEFIFYQKGAPLKKYWVNEILGRLCPAANVKYFSLHCIRHHVAALLTYRLTLAQISKILRHKNLTTTDIYLKSIVKIETKGIKVLDEINGESTPDNVIPFAKNGS